MLVIPRQVHVVLACPDEVARWRDWAHPWWRVRYWSCKADLPAGMLVDEEGFLLECRHPGYLEECRTVEARRDVHQLELLEQLGGACCDVGAAPDLDRVVRPDGAAEAAAAVRRYVRPGGEEGVRISGALTASVPHHPWVREVLRRLSNRSPAGRVSDLMSEVAALYPEVVLLDLGTAGKI